MVIISARIRDGDDPQRIMEGAWAVSGERWVVVVDEDCDVRSWTDVLWRVTYFADPKKHIFQGPDRPQRGHATENPDDPFEPPTCGLGIDATMGFKDYKMNEVNRVSSDLMGRVASRWREYGLP